MWLEPALIKRVLSYTLGLVIKMKRLLIVLVLGFSFFLVVVTFQGRVVAKSDKSEGSESQSSQGQGSSGSRGHGSSGESVEKKDLPPQAKSVRLEGEGDTLFIQPLDDEGEELEFSRGAGVGRFEIESDDEDDEVEVKSENDAALVIRNKLAAQTHFPLMVNLETNELIVTTPKGQKVVTVLPDQAVAHMLAAKVLDQLGGKGGIRWLESQEASASATPVATASATPIATASAEPSASPSAELAGEELPVTLTTDEQGELVYEIRGVKFERLLGLILIGLNRTVIVSAETGELLSINQGIFTRLLDLLSI